MGKPRPTPVVALVLALIVGVCCLVSGAGVSFFGAARQGDEPGDVPLPIDPYSVCWVILAATVLLVAMWLLWRKIRRGRQQ